MSVVLNMLAPTHAVPRHSSLLDRQTFRAPLPPASWLKTECRFSDLLSVLIQVRVVVPVVLSLAPDRVPVVASVLEVPVLVHPSVLVSPVALVVLVRCPVLATVVRPVRLAHEPVLDIVLLVHRRMAPLLTASWVDKSNLLALTL